MIVSVRMPKTLSKELKKAAREKHFLDVSEEIRSIVRKKWIENTNPLLFELKKLREEVSGEVRKRSISKVQDQVNKELEIIKRRLKEGGILDE